MEYSMVSKNDEKLLVFGIIGSWLLCWLFLPKVSILTIFLLLVLLVYKRSKGVALVLLLNPFVFLIVPNSIQGVVDYHRGKAEIRSYGYPSPQFINIDSEYRLERRSMGCSISGTSVIAATAYNKTIKALVSRRGYQIGSYTGVLPSREEANILISTDTLDVIECRLEDEKELHLTDDSSDYVLSVANQHILVKRTLLGREVIKHPKTVRLDDSSVLCQVNDKWIYVMDFEGDKVLAQYRVEENSY